MIGWRARLGFLVPPGNPTVEAEMMALVPAGVSPHFHRLAAGGGVPGALDNQDARTRAMIDGLDASVALLAMVKPDIIVIAHTATSYYLGREREADLLARLSAESGSRVVTAFGSVVAALERLGVRRLALGAPYSAETTAAGKKHLEAHRFTVVKSDNLKGVSNIYDETAERADLGVRPYRIVFPAKAGIHRSGDVAAAEWVPAFAGKAVAFRTAGEPLEPSR